MKNKYLPIGSVVLLKDATKKLMITGYCSMLEDDPENVYDYTGCLFPESNLAGEEIALFNHDQIEVIKHLGLEDDEFKLFNDNLVKTMAEDEEVKVVPAQEQVSSKAEGSEPVLDVFGDPSKLPPFTPENMKKILSMVNLQDISKSQVSEPTPFDLSEIKLPSLKKPSLASLSKEKPKEGPIFNKAKIFDVSDDEEENLVLGDGKPVLQLTPIFDVLDDDLVEEAPAGNSGTNMTQLTKL